MLKLKPNPTFTIPVEISVAGALKPATLDVEFKHKPKSELLNFTKALNDGRSDDEILSDIIVSWKGLEEEYSASSLRDLLDNYPASGLELLRAYLAALTESRRKNS